MKIDEYMLEGLSSDNEFYSGHFLKHFLKRITNLKEIKRQMINTTRKMLHSKLMKIDEYMSHLIHSGKCATIRESNHGSGICKEHYA